MEDIIYKLITKRINTNLQLTSYIRFGESKTFTKNEIKSDFLENKKAILKTFEGYTIFRHDVFEIKGFARQSELNLIRGSEILTCIEQPTLYMNLFLFNNQNNLYFKELPLSIINSTIDEGYTSQSNSLEVIKNNEVVLVDDDSYRTKLYSLNEDEEQEIVKTWDKKIEDAKDNFNIHNRSSICRMNKHRYPVFLEYATENILATEDEL